MFMPLRKGQIRNDGELTGPDQFAGVVKEDLGKNIRDLKGAGASGGLEGAWLLS